MSWEEKIERIEAKKQAKKKAERMSVGLTILKYNLDNNVKTTSTLYAIEDIGFSSDTSKRWDKFDGSGFK